MGRNDGSNLSIFSPGCVFSSHDIVPVLLTKVGKEPGWRNH